MFSYHARPAIFSPRSAVMSYFVLLCITLSIAVALLPGIMQLIVAIQEKRRAPPPPPPRGFRPVVIQGGKQKAQKAKEAS